MDTLSPGQIYLADQRGLAETNSFRRYCTFNYAAYFAEHRKPFGKLEVFNDEILAAKQASDFNIKQAAYIVLIPVTGEIIFEDAQGKVTTVDVGEIFVSHQLKNSSFKILNPYEADWINFLYLQVQANEEASNPVAKTFSFDFDATPNALIKVVSGEKETTQTLPFNMYMGRFDGRSDTVFTMQNSSSKLFAFVIAGAFEFQGRLLHERDGLALWDLHEADLEALSNNAVVLMLEIKP
ncbi:MAG: hypothetical protein ACRYFA_03990 [Janthinobacterium lividum]